MLSVRGNVPHRFPNLLGIEGIGGIRLPLINVLYVYKEFCEGLEENRPETRHKRYTGPLL